MGGSTYLKLMRVRNKVYIISMYEISENSVYIEEHQPIWCVDMVNPETVSNLVENNKHGVLRCNIDDENVSYFFKGYNRENIPKSRISYQVLIYDFIISEESEFLVMLLCH